MSFSRTTWVVCVSLLMLGGCDCAGDTGADAGDGGGDGGPRIDGGPRADTGGGGTCPNGIVEGGETCDDGNEDADDGCAADCTLECGDGRVSGDEACDTAITAGDGACPASCDDGDDCTSDATEGIGCAVTCSHSPITLPAHDDMCCPSGADATSDNDCPGRCGDGLVTGSEACDTTIAAGSVGACPTNCDDGMACTSDGVSGAGTCDAICTNTPITAPAAGDGCCPTGATVGTDGDCPIACGDGVLSAGETCDTAIASGTGSCPSACDDGLACTTDVLSSAGTCNAICTATPITTPTNGDGCCPTGATMATDNDCSGACGDGILQAGENCDTAIAAGMPGRCPATCNDGMACTADTLTGAGTCSAACTSTPITAPANGDGCCPSGATIGTDNDCPRVCGDGVRTAPETCDTAIASGPGSCPTTCSDGMACTSDMLANAGSCTAVCRFTAITTPSNGDGCCPTGATIGNDSDCLARCGDGVTTAPETCDDGNTTAGDGCSATCRAEAASVTAFRMTDLDIRDPHLWANVAGACRDVTNTVTVFFIRVDGVNPLLQTNIRTDGDSPTDGLLDLSIVETFAPLVQTAGSSTMTRVTFPECTTPYTATMCTLPVDADRTATVVATNQGGGATCLGTLPMTTRYTFPVPTAPSGGTCYSAAAGTIMFDLGGIPITLASASIGGRYFGTPATEIRDGLIRGFISYAQAQATIIPEGTTGQAAIDGEPLSSLLRTTSTGGSTPGGCGSSAMASDLDVGPDGTTPGWWFYLNFAAAPPVSYAEL